MSQPNEFSEELLAPLRAVLQNTEYIYKTAQYISVRHKGNGPARIYTVFLNGDVTTWGPQKTVRYGWRVMTEKQTYFHKFPTVHEALKFVQTGVVLKLYGDNVPEYFTRR